MKKRFQTVHIIAGILFFVALSAGQALAQEKARVLHQRTLPLPYGASDALKELIARTPQTDVGVHAQRTTFKTKEQWLQFIQRADGFGAAQVDLMIGRYEVEVTEEQISGVTVRTVQPQSIDPKNKNRLFIHIHGGAYVLGAGKVGLGEAIIIAHRARIPVLSIDYRMPPGHPFPAALHDVVTVYKHLLKKHPAGSMALGGTSAGGGLALASIHKFIKLGLPVPAAVFAGSPWSDLTKVSDSYFINEGVDSVLVTNDGLLEGAAKLYANGHDMKDPLLSPVYGDAAGFPPTYFVTGTRDLFLSNTVRMHRKLRAAGIAADLNVYEGMSHADYLFAMDAPESKQVFEELRVFLLQHLQ